MDLRDRKPGIPPWSGNPHKEKPEHEGPPPDELLADLILSKGWERFLAPLLEDSRKIHRTLITTHQGADERLAGQIVLTTYGKVLSDAYKRARVPFPDSFRALFFGEL